MCVETKIDIDIGTEIILGVFDLRFRLSAGTGLRAFCGSIKSNHTYEWHIIIPVVPARLSFLHNPCPGLV